MHLLGALEAICQLVFGVGGLGVQAPLKRDHGPLTQVILRGDICDGHRVTIYSGARQFVFELNSLLRHDSGGGMRSVNYL